MREREFEALLEALEDAVDSPKPAQAILLDVKDLISRARTASSSAEANYAMPHLSRTSSPSDTHTQLTSGLIEALQEVALRVKGTQAAPVSAVSPPIPHVVYPENQRAAAFQRCFPYHAKYFQFNVQKSNLLKRCAKGTFKSAFTPDATRFVLCAANGAYHIYNLPKIGLDDGPTLQFSGTVPDTTQHCHVALNNDWLVLGNATGTIRVISLKTGQVLWTHKLSTGITALGISPTGAYIGVSFLSNNREGVCQPLVLLLCPDTCTKDASSFSHVVEITFVSPYLDPVRTLNFSPDELHAVCSTSQESRFFVVSLVDLREPRLVARSSRKVPADIYRDYEGITSALFFPRRSAIAITSVAPNSPPIVVDPKISKFPCAPETGVPSTSSSSSRSQSQILLKAEKVGSCIHTTVVSPQENAMAFLDRTGLVYLVFWPKAMEHSKKVSVVFELTGARSYNLAASLRFSEDGTTLYAVDSRGLLHVADFGAAMPQSPGITRLRPLS